MDLNVFVSAVIARGAPADLVRRVGAGDAEVVVCPRLLDELSEVLHRPKFARFVCADEAAAFLVRLRDPADERPDPVDVAALSRDADDYLVALAIESDAEVLVTGDRDLLELTDPPVRILTRPKCWPNSTLLRTRARAEPLPSILPSLAHQI